MEEGSPPIRAEAKEVVKTVVDIEVVGLKGAAYRGGVDMPTEAVALEECRAMEGQDRWQKACFINRKDVAVGVHHKDALYILRR